MGGQPEHILFYASCRFLFRHRPKSTYSKGFEGLLEHSERQCKACQELKHFLLDSTSQLALYFIHRILLTTNLTGLNLSFSLPCWLYHHELTLLNDCIATVEIWSSAVAAPWECWINWYLCWNFWSIIGWSLLGHCFSLLSAVFQH